ncbi:ImmA/IrrE family metallo-endopeptidase [Priestia megaterium]
MEGVVQFKDSYSSFNRIRIETIHGVPVYGRLPKRHLTTLKKVKLLTTQEEWNGIKGVYCSDGIASHGVSGMYITAKKDQLDAHVSINALQGNNEYLKLKLTHNDLPAIVVCSFNDEYMFANVLTHELGHHVNGHNAENVHETTLEEREVEANVFAMRKIKKSQFESKKEPCIYFWGKAKEEYFKRYGYDEEIHSVYDVEANFIGKPLLEKTLAYFTAVNLAIPKLINHSFKNIKEKLININKPKLKSPWREELLAFQ